MGTLKGPQKAKVFISSLNTYKLQSGKTLSKVRRQLAKKIETRFPFIERAKVRGRILKARANRAMRRELL
jgi:hypothetical protein